MKNYFLIILCYFLAVSPSSSQDSTFIKTHYLGSDSLNITSRCFSGCDSNIVFIQLHEDEITGIEAAEEFFIDNSGYLVQLKQRGERFIKFAYRNRPYTVDPNRIFTKAGLKENMTKLKSYRPEVAAEVTKFSKELLSSYVDDKKLIVALHNNTDNKFSILSYKKGNPEAANAAKLHINKDMDPDDFILTTDSSIYRKIKDKNINVVLQSTRAKDDGSLSIYAQRNKIPYINIEAQHGHFEEQLQMLFAIKDIIAGYTEIIDLNYIDNKK